MGESQSLHHLTASQGSLGVVIGCPIGIPSVLYFGSLSDRVGRVPVLRYACLGMVLYAVPSWWLLSLGNPAISIAVIAGGFAPLIGSLLLLEFSNAWWPVAAYVAVMAGIGFLATFFIPETRGRDLTLLNDARPNEDRW